MSTLMIRFVKSYPLSEVAMPTVRFQGRVIPMTHGISIETVPVRGWKDSELELTMDFTFDLKESNIVLAAELNKFSEKEHYFSVLMRASDTAKAIVDVFAFSTGLGLTVILDTFTDPAGNVKDVIIGDRRLGALATATRGGSSLADVLRIVVTSPPLYLALRDLIEAATQFHRAPASAARAIEALRHSVAPDETDRKKQWKMFEELLRVEQSYMEIIKKSSIGPRHGDPVHIPGAITADLSMRAWTIMNRYLEFRKRGAKRALPVSEFPVLI